MEKMKCVGCYHNNNCLINMHMYDNIVNGCAFFVKAKPTYPMYRIATKKRKYSTTPIVRVTLDGNGNEQEDIVICVVLPKKDGDVLSNTIVELLNK